MDRMREPGFLSSVYFFCYDETRRRGGGAAQLPRTLKFGFFNVWGCSMIESKYKKFGTEKDVLSLRETMTKGEGEL